MYDKVKLKYTNGKMRCKYYRNDNKELHDKYIRYYFSKGNLMWKKYYINGKEYGLNTDYHHIESGRLISHIYHL